MVWCGVVQCGVVRSDMVWYGAVWCGVVWCSMAKWYTHEHTLIAGGAVGERGESVLVLVVMRCGEYQYSLTHQ